MFEPLLMSKQIFDALPKDQQAAIMAAGAEQEKFALESAKADDTAVADVYAKAGAKVVRPRRSHGEEVAGDRARDRVEGLRREEREQRQAARRGDQDVVSHPAEASGRAAGARSAR